MKEHGRANASGRDRHNARRSRPSAAFGAWTRPGVRSPELVGRRHAVGAAGLVLAANPGTPRLLYDGAANGLLVLATALSWSAARVFVGRPVLPLVIAAGPLVALLTVSMPFDEVRPKIGVAAACALGSGYTLAAAAELWRGREEDLTLRRVAYFLLLIHGALYAAYAAAVLLVPGNHGLPEAVRPPLIIEALMHSTAMAFVLLAMTKERAELRSTRSLIAARDAALSISETKSRFLARMSHEVRTPLNAVLGLATVLAHDERLGPGQRELALTLEQAGRHLLSIVNDVLDLAKIEAGKLILMAQPFDLRVLLEGCLSLLRGLSELKQIGLRLEIAPDVPCFVEGDDTRVRQVVLNLLSNAVKFSPIARRSFSVRVWLESGSGSK